MSDRCTNTTASRDRDAQMVMIAKSKEQGTLFIDILGIFHESSKDLCLATKKKKKKQ